MTRLPHWAYCPDYASGTVVATNRGWVVKETGEILVSFTGLASALFKLGLLINSYELVLEDGVKPEAVPAPVDPEVTPEPVEAVPEVVEEQEVATVSEPAEPEEVETDDEPEKDAPGDEDPKKEPAKKRGRPKKNK